MDRTILIGRRIEDGPTRFNGSLGVICENCEQAMWLGPRQQEFWQDHPEAKVNCFQCADEVYGYQHLAGFLGNQE